MKVSPVRSHLWVPRQMVPAKLPGELETWPKCVACSRSKGPWSDTKGPGYPVEMMELLNEGVRDGHWFFEIGVRCHGKFEAFRVDFDAAEKPPARVLENTVGNLHFFVDS